MGYPEPMAAGGQRDARTPESLREKEITVRGMRWELSMTHLDLFTGIGGFALAAQVAGFRTVACVEIDPWCQALAKQNFPHAEIYGDIKKFDGTKYRGVTLLTGGFPCQPYSLAGEQRGDSDDRALWPEMLRVIREARPAWIIGENVPGIIEMALEGCVADLEAEGYEVAPPFIVPALAVNAGHRRDRVWIVAHANRERIERRRRSGIKTFGRKPFGQATGSSEIALADSTLELGSRHGRTASIVGRCGKNLADSNGARKQQPQGNLGEGRERFGNGSEAVAYAGGAGRKERHSPAVAGGTAHVAGGNNSGGADDGRLESGVGRAAYGLPERVDVAPPGPFQEEWEAPRTVETCEQRRPRIKGLGNAIVPAVAFQFIGAIAELEREK